MSDTDRCPGCCSILKRSWGRVQLSQSPGLKQLGQAHLVRFTSGPLSARTLAQGMLLQASPIPAGPSASTSACSCSLPLSLCGKRTLFWGQQRGFSVFLCVLKGSAQPNNCKLAQPNSYTMTVMHEWLSPLAVQACFLRSWKTLSADLPAETENLINGRNKRAEYQNHEHLKD